MHVKSIEVQNPHVGVIWMVTFDDGPPVCAAEVQEIVDLSESLDSDSDAEIADETPVKTVTFSNALHCLGTVETYLMQRNINDAAFSSLGRVER
ncbi:hypothetical protein TNCV_2978991 [Trichonephila clavipes]|nr:hypothetical protein TNCV_2978991 [Trichonephila clavipes]